MAEDTRSGEVPPSAVGADIRTFLFADMRGYTRFTQEHGDDAASALASRFADLVREAVPDFEGELLELRGDEALCVFRSARQALRASVELQRRLRTPTDQEPAFPLGVGMGLDAGEAIPTHGGYRGASLNLAARLCALAKPGEILATENVAHFAHRVDGLRLLEGRSAALKGMARPVRYVVVEPNTPLPPVPLLVAAGRGGSRWTVLVVGVVGLLALVVVGGLSGFFWRSGSATVRPFPRPAFYRVDPSSGHIELGIALGDRPSAVAAGGGAFWVADAGLGVVERVDPTNPQRPIPIPVGDEPAGVVVTPTAVWVANSGDGTVTRITPSGRPLPPFRVGNGPAGIVAYDHAIWVTLSLDDAVVRINPVDDSVSDPIPAGPDPTAIAGGAGHLWVTNESRGEITAIDPHTLRAQPPIAVGAGPHSIIADPADVWVANTLDRNVSDIDPAGGATRQVFLLDGNPTSLTPEPGGGVLATTASGALWRIDRTAARRINSLGVQPQATVASDGKLWVAASAPPGPHRGGTLILASAGSELPTRTEPNWSSMDPASGDAWWYQGWATLALTNDGLVSFKKVGGADGGTVVPDLAQTIPKPTHGGHVWTFTVRSGIHYSDGTLVKPSDFRRAIQRVFLFDTAMYYGDILGAEKCTTERCDLHQGIVPNDAHHTVTFILTKPDPEFLYHLALPFADAVPPSVPDTDTGANGVPATGPYMLQSFTPKTGALTLVRNPQFHEWSPDAQPSGYPDRIQWRPFRTGLDALHAVEHGRADWMFDLVPQRVLRRAKLAYPNRFHPGIFPYTGVLYLNVHRPPFRSSLPRIALNIAINRETFLTAAHAEGQQLPTCQLAPPNIFGYAPICPDGPPQPDRARARRDVLISGTAGTRVTVGLPRTAPAREAFRTLASIGYKPAWTSPANADVFAYFYAADYPSIANFLEFACLGVCENHAKLQTLVKRAQAAELSSQPGRAGPIWNAAEREYLRIGPSWVPLFHAASLGFVSARVGNYQFAPPPGDSPLIDQMWVK